MKRVSLSEKYKKRIGATIKELVDQEISRRKTSRVAYAPKVLGVSRQWLYAMEIGKANFSFDRLERLATALGVPLERLLNENGKRK